MRRRMMKSKIHRATVTGANLDYVGSVSIDTELMALADILPYERPLRPARRPRRRAEPRDRRSVGPPRCRAVAD